MARRRTRIPLNVYLNSRLVGRLRREASGAIDFQYDAEWLAWESAIPVSLSMPLREERFIGDPVVAIFDNLLPDNDEIRNRLAARSGADGADAFSLLAAVGRDCVGALQFLPDGEDPGAAGKLDGRMVDDAEIAAILAGLKQNPLGVGDDREFRISIAGAQEKTALLFWNGKWHIPHGTSATTHILKPQIGKLRNGFDLSHSVENEHLCMELVRALGLPTARTEIADFDEHRALVIERFDRRWTRDKRLLRLPQEDCCQALSVPPNKKYEPDGGPGISVIAGMLKGSDSPGDDLRLFMAAQIVFWLIGATDGHAKNFSVFLAPGGRFRMTPLYDIMSAQPLLDAGQIRRNQMKLAMAVGDKRRYRIDEIAPRHFLQSAAIAGIGRGVVDSVFSELKKSTPTAIAHVQKTLPASFPEDLAAQVFSGLEGRLRLIE